MEIVEKSDRRNVCDRRKQPTLFASRHTFISGRRKIIRRELDKKKYIFVDWYSPQLLITLLILVILSLLDASFTLTLIKEHGMVEANPVMAFYLECSDISFITGKFLFTTVSIFIFCLYNNFFVTKVSLASSIIMYLVVILYELNIMHQYFL
jgi:hypothetical protein